MEKTSRLNEIAILVGNRQNWLSAYRKAVTSICFYIYWWRKYKIILNKLQDIAYL